MNLLFSTIQGDIAGSTYSVFYLANGLAERGHQVYCACREESLLNKLCSGTKIKTVRLTSYKRIDLTLAKELAHFCNKNQIQIVNAQSSSDRYAAILSSSLYGMKALVTTTRRQKPQTDAGFLLNRLLSTKISWFIAVSNSIKKELIEKGFPERKIKVIFNGTPKEKYQLGDPGKTEQIAKSLNLQPDVPVIGSVSRLKEQQQIIEALKLIPKPVQAVFIGISEKDLDLTGLNQSLHTLTFIPHVENAEVLYYYKLFDVFVLASTMEGISQAILESMAMGVPVIATNSSGNPDLVKNDKNGFLFENGDIKQLASRIEIILNDQEIKERFILEGRKTVLEDFSIDNTVRNYEEFFESIVKD